MINFFGIFKFLALVKFILNDFRNNKSGVTAVEYAVVVAGVISVMVLICLGNDSVLANLFTSVFREAVSGILNNFNQFISLWKQMKVLLFY